MAESGHEAERAPEEVSVQEQIRLRRLKLGKLEKTEARREAEQAQKEREAAKFEQEQAERAREEAEVQAAAEKAAAEKEAAENIPIQEKFKPGQWVEIFGLGSADGKKLNNKVGTVVHYVYERIRFEVRLAPDKVVAVRPVNLREAERPDKKWRFGDICRLVCLREEEDEDLRKKSGCLGTLRFRGKDGTWKVESFGSLYAVKVDQLRVCERPDTEGKSKLEDLDDSEPRQKIGPPQIVAGVLIAVTSGLLLAVGSAVLDIHRGPDLSIEGGYGDEPDLGSRILGSAVSPLAPGLYAGGLSLLCLFWLLVSQWMTIGVCAWNHRCLWDPQTSFPQLAELSVGRPSVRTLCRCGLGCVSVLLFSTNWLHKELVMPHLPWANGDSLEAETAVFWVVGAAAGIGLQGFFTLTEQWGYHSLAHHFGGLMVAYCVFQHLRETRKFYLPGTQPLNEGVEEGVERDDIKEAMEMALESPLLKNPYVLSAIMLRFHLLGLWPWGLLMLPVLQHIFEKMPEESKVTGNTIWRSLYAWTQWYFSCICSCLLMTYGPEMVIASLLPMQVAADSASANDKFFF